MKMILAVILLTLVSACGTISSQDYTDAKVEAAIANARIEGMESAAIADARREEQTREAIRLLLEQWASQEGRRPHKPGGA